MCAASVRPRNASYFIDFTVWMVTTGKRSNCGNSWTATVRSEKVSAANVIILLVEKTRMKASSIGVLYTINGRPGGLRQNAELMEWGGSLLSNGDAVRSKCHWLTIYLIISR